MAADPGRTLLEFLSSRYLQARRVTDDLRSRLKELEQAKGWGGADQPSSRTLTKDRVKRSIERSTVASSERLRALELVLSSCVPQVLPLLQARRKVAPIAPSEPKPELVVEGPAPAEPVVTPPSAPARFILPATVPSGISELEAVLFQGAIEATEKPPSAPEDRSDVGDEEEDDESAPPAPAPSGADPSRPLRGDWGP